MSLKPPKKLTAPPGKTEVVSLTKEGRLAKATYLLRREELTGKKSKLNERYDSAKLWNYVGRICKSLDACPSLFVDKLIEHNHIRDGFPFPTKFASGYAGKTYLRMLGVTDVDDFDEEGCLMPHALARVRELTLVRTSELAKTRPVDDDMVLLVDEVNNTWAELNAGITIIHKACDTTDMMSEKVTEFLLRPFCVIPPYVVLMLAWKNEKVRLRFIPEAKQFLRENPDWLRNAETLGLTSDVRAVRVLTGLR